MVANGARSLQFLFVQGVNLLGSLLHFVQEELVFRHVEFPHVLYGVSGTYVYRPVLACCLYVALLLVQVGKILYRGDECR